MEGDNELLMISPIVSVQISHSLMQNLKRLTINHKLTTRNEHSLILEWETHYFQNISQYLIRSANVNSMRNKCRLIQHYQEHT